MDTQTRYVIRIKKDAKVRYAGFYLHQGPNFLGAWQPTASIFWATSLPTEKEALEQAEVVGDPYLEVVPMTVIIPE
jgi:hypothetical protein